MGIEVPVLSFFQVAPVIVAAVYIYFHLYLLLLWDNLSDAPSKVDGRPLSTCVYPWLISQAALYYRNQRRDDGSSEPKVLGWALFVSTLGFTWLSGVLVLIALWRLSMPVHSFALTVWISIWLMLSLFVGISGLRAAQLRLTGVEIAEVVGASRVPKYSFLLLAFCLALLSYETTIGGLIPHKKNQLPPLLVTADLQEAELTKRPEGWKPFALWLIDLRESNGDTASSEKHVPTRDEIERWQLLTEALDAPSLRGRDLRGANLKGAFLPGADLRGADLGYVDLQFANTQGARFEVSVVRVFRNALAFS